jgi:TetR/AcrR family transcriptional regulator, transcriptional repressor for nem operon
MARPRKFDEAEVIAAARDQFWSTGYAGTSLDDLTAATCLGRGSLYAAFGDKHALFLTALDEYTSTVMAAVTEDLRAADAPAIERLTAHIRNTASASPADARRGCLVAKSAAELGATDKAVLQRVRRALMTYQGQLRVVIEQAQQEGDIDPNVDAEALALMVLTMLRGSEALRKAGFPPAKIRTVAEQTVALLSDTAVALTP